MNWLTNLIVVVQILTGLAIVGLVLVQQGKGADMGASFGSGASGSLFGATGSANFLSRSTAVCAAVFFACTLALAFFAHGVKSNAAQESVLDSPLSGSATGTPVGASAPVTTDAAKTSAVPSAVPTAVPGSVTPVVPSVPAAAAASAADSAASK